MTVNDLENILHYLSRVPVRGFEDEEELVKLMTKINAQIKRSTKVKNVYTESSTKVA